MKKVAFRSLIQSFRKTTSIAMVASFARQYLRSELHIHKTENRRKIVQMLEETFEMERIVKTFFYKP